jgi:hypothetical protein
MNDMKNALNNCQIVGNEESRRDEVIHFASAMASSLSSVKFCDLDDVGGGKW